MKVCRVNWKNVTQNYANLDFFSWKFIKIFKKNDFEGKITKNLHKKFPNLAKTLLKYKL